MTSHSMIELEATELETNELETVELAPVALAPVELESAWRNAVLDGGGRLFEGGAGAPAEDGAGSQGG